ncbi:4-alpha-glucanotransferase/malto-oligosyltrehalose synthase,TIGR02401 [Cnuella takakiae]|uniref:4-alpha-glucanotransferase n=1 Tax=Cnuella takakiae TaxID=1302690 RepID=A0A1M5BZC3_9BACT|nr:malto-oligosyltrehalose synthase [Cnuella takakiae]OLY93563.1 4-alpha-glucanotransferase [Cnuella takakiae]SHF47697.1 4-alpha-glucanotransferase/malto-oligosyltrehalose synthase,TIGR02401 [Cnuella takakiae]
MYNPKSTYRIQFHKDFTLSDLERTRDYLKQLGVGTIYASPIFEATPGSTHGYDALNPLRINPEIGTEEQLRNITQKLQQDGIGWLQDIVPNHMAFDPRNPWLADVLEKGPLSHYAPFFDIAWDNALQGGQLMVPFLGDTLDAVIEKGELKLALQDGKLYLQYYDSKYPVHPRSYANLLESGGKKLQGVQQLLTQLETLLGVTEKESFAAQWQDWLQQFQSLLQNKAIVKAIEQNIQAANSNKALLTAIAVEQAYRLCHWQETDYQINFRRFFTVNGLICLNIQDEAVLVEHHALIKQLVQDEVFQGLRIDHIDGLYDPTSYLQRLREMTGEETYIVVEKILEPGEDMPAYWPIEGSSGYDFLAQVNNLLTNQKGEPAFTRFYCKLSDDSQDVHSQIHDKKSYILFEHMAGELDNLFHLFMDANLVDRKALAHIHREDLKNALAEFLIHCPVYRFYGNGFPLSMEEAGAVHKIFSSMRKANAAKPAAIGVLEDVLLHLPPLRNEAYNQRAAHFFQRCMQFTGPLMAKGVEDTIMYTYNRFIGHNEVGDAPDAFGTSVQDFHRQMQVRQEQWPYALNGTSTHDTKRGEDVRARLNVLTDIPEQWLEKVQEWQELNAPLKKEEAPDANDEYFIYQTIAGAYPMPGMDEDDFANRLQEYLQKALREAKRHSNWTRPDEAYEGAAKNFAVQLLQPKGAFWKSFQPFHQLISDAGIANSLVQVLLKFTCPGVPDVYQGCEFWDLSLVDPDNRRAADYGKRMAALQSFEGADAAALLPELWENRFDARIKLWLTQQLVALRNKQPYLFTEGDYLPLEVTGKYKDHVLAFARRHRQLVYVIAAPLHLASLCLEQSKTVLELDWADTRINLPEQATEDWDVLLTGATEPFDSIIPVQGLFTKLPLAVLKGHLLDNERGAGILLHISSLPSPYGIGDMGKDAYLFADFLFRSNQKYWQLLPLNPTEAGQGHSPYSSISSRAGNTLLISPKTLADEGWLSKEEIRAAMTEGQSKVDYTIAESIKQDLFEKAYVRFREQAGEQERQAFQQFCGEEKDWLDDFALYVALKKEQGGKAWFQWPAEYMNRDAKALTLLASLQERELEKTKWLQWHFARQWKALRSYCNGHGIRFIGDLPIYVSYDSVDVWAHRHLFAIDEEGGMTGVAGTPPDSFSADGQLWGMPVFRWDAHEEEGFAWWIDRLQRNTELFDLVRIDHFRAFADYWEVPAAAATAKEGSWKPGPGAAFFTAVQEALGSLPFVAEDLGEINKAVTDLRDQFRLPGMKILLFAFGEEMPRSDYIPHNYGPNFLVYTGTHDNNTTRGWYQTEADEDTRARLEAYTGRAISAAEVHLVLAQMAYASVAKTAILPLQDLLGLDENSRMNMPGQGQNNWAWRLVPGQLNEAAEDLLQKWTWLYNRG